MPIEIKVAPPSIVISQGRTFMVTDQWGEITPASDEGVYARDTRFISDYHLYINREPWTLLTSSQVNFYTSRFHLTDPKLSTQDGELEPNTIGLTLERTVGEGIHEDFYIANYNNKQINFVLKLAIHSDFADLFEVKAHRPAHMVQTILGLRADAPRKRLYVNPTLPTWLPAIEFRDIRVGPCSISLRFWREGEHSRWEVSDMRSDQGTAEEDRITVVDEREEFSTPYGSNPALLAELLPVREVLV